MPKIVVNLTPTPLTIFTRIDIPVGRDFDLDAAAVACVEGDPVIRALMDAGLVSIEEREEPAPDGGAGFQAVEPEDITTPADLPQPAAFPAEAAAEGDGAAVDANSEAAPADTTEAKADKPASKKTAAKA